MTAGLPEANLPGASERSRNEAFYSTLRVLLERIAALRPLQESLRDIVRLIESQFPSKSGSINMLTSDGLRIERAYSPSLPPEYMHALEGLAIGPCAGSCGTAAYERRTVIVSDIDSDPLWTEYRSLAAPYGLRSCWSLPIFDARGKILGTFAIYGKEPAAPVSGELELVADCAHIAGIAIARAQADEQLREQASLLDKAHDAIIVRSLDNRILFWNRGAERLYGWTPEEAIGRRIDELLYRETSDFEAGTRHTLEAEEWLGELQQIAKDGHGLWVEAHWSLVRGDDGQPRSILAINTDISQRKAAEREIYTLAFHDSLTGLPNRQLLLNRLDLALHAAARSAVSGAVLFLDLDNFKSLNDTQGHDVGDKLLVQVAQRLGACIRDSDTVARIGGDEFVVMLIDLSGSRAEAASQAQGVAEKILQSFATPFDLDGYECSSTPSVGIAMFSDTQLSVDEVLKRADLAMYQAKAAGCNTIRFFDPEMQAAVSLRVQMETDLRRALINKEFLLYYQPQVDADSRVVGAEALIRWQHPQHGLVTPFNFVPIAENCGLILPIGIWVLEAACRQLADWSAQAGFESLSVAVNVSARQFRHADFVAQVQGALDRSGADPRRLKLELTESLLLDNVEETIDKMHALRRIGVSFSLDDFGTGYSSLSYLKRLPLAQIKIDPSFVREILDNPSDKAIARTVIALGHSLGLEVIAEGVETEAQRQLLLELGCTCYQGYLFSRPVPVEQFTALGRMPALAPE
jgi:diguanylate cyclase (GGDEF)-like protein/PAS domain S-box-containing protein